MSGLAARLKTLTRPTPDEERRVLRAANGALVRTSARVMRPERGELERVLRQVPRGRGARRFGAAVEPLEIGTEVDDNTTLKRRVLGVLLLLGALGGAGLAKAAPTVRAVLAGGLDALTFTAPAPPALAEVEAATCEGPEEAPAGAASAARTPGAGPSPGPGASMSTGSGLEPDALAVPVTVAAHPNPRLVYTVGGAGGGNSMATPGGGGGPSLPGPIAPMSGNGSGTPGGTHAPAGGVPGGDGPEGAPLVPLPDVPGLDGPSTFSATAPLTDPTPSGRVDHDVGADGSPLAVDQTSQPSVCPVWPGEPGASDDAVARPAPPPLQPAAIVATAPSVMDIPLAVAAPPRPRAKTPGPRTAAPSGAGSAVPLADARSKGGLPQPAPSRRGMPDLSAGFPVTANPASPVSPTAPASPVAPAVPAAPAAPVESAGSGPPSVADTQALLNDVVFGAGRGAPPPDPADCDPEDAEP